MRHDTAQIFVSATDDAGAVERALRDAAHALPGATRVALARNLEGCWNAGDSSSLRRMYSPITPRGPAIRNGTRQPQESISASVRRRLLAARRVVTLSPVLAFQMRAVPS